MSTTTPLTNSQIKEIRNAADNYNNTVSLDDAYGSYADYNSGIKNNFESRREYEKELQGNRAKSNAELERIAAARQNNQSRSDTKSSDRNSPRYNYNTYKQDYFSGTQARIFFGDIWVDDIITIQYNIAQNKTPIYGYASQTFDAVAMGTILGQGSLSIAFKEVGYLNIIHNLLEYQKGKNENAAKNIANKMNGTKSQQLDSTKYANQEYSAIVNTNSTPSLIRQMETVEEVMYNLKTDHAEMPFKLSGKSINDFEDVAELYEDAIWGDNNGNLYNDDLMRLLRADEFDYKVGKNGPEGINIGRNENFSNTLNIMLTFGDINDYRAEHTIIVLNDVHFTGQGMVVAPNGEPIAETYEFFFQDINRTLVNTSSFTINPAKLGSDKNPSNMTEINNFKNNIIGKPTSLGVRFLHGVNYDTGDMADLTQTINGYFDDFTYVGYAYIGKNGSRLIPHNFEDHISNLVSAVAASHLDITMYSPIVVEVTELDNTKQPISKSYPHLVLKQTYPGMSHYKVDVGVDNFQALNLVSRSDFYKTADEVDEKGSAKVARQGDNNFNSITADYNPANGNKSNPVADSGILKSESNTGDVNQAFDGQITYVDNGAEEIAAQQILDGSSVNPSFYYNKDGFNKYAKNHEKFYNDIHDSIYKNAVKQGVANPEVIASLGAAQAAIESGWGKSAPGYNYFGIKGKGGSYTTTEVVNGKTVTVKQDFAGYKSLDDATESYVRVLRNSGKGKYYDEILSSKTYDTAVDALLDSPYGTAFTDPKKRAAYYNSLHSIYNSYNDYAVSHSSTEDQLKEFVKTGKDTSGYGHATAEEKAARLKEFQEKVNSQKTKTQPHTTTDYTKLAEFWASKKK